MMSVINRFAIPVVPALVALTLTPVAAQITDTLVGTWAGRRAEVDPGTRQSFTINFTFDFRTDGTYRYSATEGGRQVLELRGRYTVRQAGIYNFGGTRVPRYLLALSPEAFTKQPSAHDLFHLTSAALPNIEPSSHVLFFDSPGSANLDGRPGPERWGFNRVK
jgi:hypothetical protein